MRTTLTLDDDVVVTVKEEMNTGAGKTFKEAVNELIRRGRYASTNSTPTSKPFKVRSFNMGVFPDINYDKSSELLAILDEEEYK